MLESAAKKFGSHDFGDDRFLEGLRILCHSLSADANLHAAGRFFAKSLVLSALGCRLELSQRWREYPEVLKTSIEKPIFIVGSARTGTSFLFDLMAQDDQFRFLRTWEARRPGRLQNDQRQKKKAIKKTRIELHAINYMRPELKKIHNMTPYKPEECNPLLTNSFEAIILRYLFGVHAYYDWYSKQNHKYQYAYYKKQIQWLQKDTISKRWLLKAPSHLSAFQSLVDEFPDAVFIQTHRDIVESLPSNCSLKYNLQSMTSYEANKKEIGRFVMEDLCRILQSTFEVRAKNQLNILDIQYKDLIEKPMAVLKRIYNYIEERFSESAQKRVTNYLALNQKDKFGKHNYSLEEFYLDEKTIHDKFDFYNQVVWSISSN